MAVQGGERLKAVAQILDGVRGPPPGAAPEDPVRDMKVKRSQIALCRTRRVPGSAAAWTNNFFSMPATYFLG